MTHSLVDCVALAIETPAGIVIHSGDFKIDLTPPDGQPFDLHAFAEYGKRGVLAFLQDSTNVDRHGHTPSERAVRPALDGSVCAHQAAAFLQLFFFFDPSPSHCDRPGASHGRKVAIVGRSMQNSFEIAQDFNYLDVPDSQLIAPGEVKDYAPEKVSVFISGTQGEPMSALTRAAVDNHRQVKIEPGDTVILSSRVIPGNEKSIFRMIDHLYRRDAHVIYDDGTNGLIHVSGHASQDELRLLLHLLKPKFFVPLHGDYRHLKLHAELAAELGVVEKILLLENGDVLEMTKDSARKHGKVAVGRVCIDAGSTAGVVEDVVMRDRRHLSEGGIVLPILAINQTTGRVESMPEIVTRGFAAGEEALIEQARQVVGATLEASSAKRKPTTASSKKRSVRI